MLKPYTNLIGYPGTTNVLGDVVIDLDQNFKPVWVWNAFDHLDVNRHPMQFPDWTHSNAIVYSPDDGNFLISSRHQNWVIKVDYNNGAGAGDIIWKLGYQGDFKLQGAVDPTDWFYAQHDVNFVSSNTTGNFKIALMDNGDDRVFPAGVTCNSAGAPPCLYTTVPIMQLDENAKTASFLFHQIIPANLYNSFAGDTRVQPNGNVEYNLAGVGTDSYVFEVTPTDTPQTVWQMDVTNTNTYRAFRMPSLYPGVQW
jgi:arylsulfate sulfotransferase